MTEAAPVPFAGWMPYPLVHDIRQFEHGGRTYFLGITVTAELVGEKPAAVLPVRADLAGRIADLIRADCADAPRPVPVELKRRDPEEARARILASDLPEDLKAALADGIGPLPPEPGTEGLPARNADGNTVA